MASIKGVSLKNVKTTTGMEGIGLLADVYLNNKKVGSYADYADGAMGNMDFVSSEMKEAFMHVVFAYANENPNEFILNLYQENPEKIKEDRERIAGLFPFLSAEEMTDKALSNYEPDDLINYVYDLLQDEKQFKKCVKSGYKYCIVTENEMFFCREEEDRKMLESRKDYIKTYTSLQDFIQ